VTAGRPADDQAHLQTFDGVLAAAARWLNSLGVTHVAMGDRDLQHAGLPRPDRARALHSGAGAQRRACQERPGRKTDLADAEWLVHLLECGLLAGSSS
jgi:hypothetical protein